MPNPRGRPANRSPGLASSAKAPSHRLPGSGIVLFCPPHGYWDSSEFSSDSRGVVFPGAVNSAFACCIRLFLEYTGMRAAVSMPVGRNVQALLRYSVTRLYRGMPQTGRKNRA